MTLRHYAATFILTLTYSYSIAQVDLSEIEAQERAQIISELSYRLDVKQNCTAKLIWDDAGSGADLDGFFFLPEVKNNEFMIGGHASQKRRSKYHCVTTVSEANDNPEGTPQLLIKPTDWQQIWKDSGSGATRDGSFWKASVSDTNYVCIGSVPQLYHNAKPELANYRCVHKSLTEKIITKTLVWSDKGSGADKPLSIFGLPNTTAFVALSARAPKADVMDLKKDARSVPDKQKVEAILAERMAPIRADIDAKANALKAEKEAAQKAEEEKIAAAKKAEQLEKEKKLAAAEKKKQEEAKKRAEKEAAAKALAEKAEAEQEKREQEAAQKLAEEQQVRIAKVMAEKEAEEKAMTEKTDEEKSTVTEEIKEETKQEAIIEEAILQQTSTEVSQSTNESKGLNHLIMFFVKIFGLMLGGVIIFMIAFKVLFGKKSSADK